MISNCCILWSLEKDGRQTKVVGRFWRISQLTLSLPDHELDARLVHSSNAVTHLRTLMG